MRIELEMMDNGIPYIQQMEAVDKYMRANTIKTEDIDFFGTQIASKPIIKETRTRRGFTQGQKVETTHKSFHVSCRKTKGGIYKFNVWQAV